MSNITITLPSIFTALDADAVRQSIYAQTELVKFGSLSVEFKSHDDLPRVLQIIEDLAAMDTAIGSGVAEVEFRDRRTKFRTLDELKRNRLTLLNALRSLVAVADVSGIPVRRNALRVRYVNYRRGY